MIPNKILTQEKTIENALELFYNSTNIFLTETKKLKYILIIDDDKKLITKIRKLLNKYKDKVNVVSMPSIEESKIFIKENSNNIQAILVQYKPQIIDQLPKENKTHIPIVMVLKDRIVESVQDLLLDSKQENMVLVSALGLL
jgi:hypothetical protein